jgi:hypothetical protein
MPGNICKEKCKGKHAASFTRQYVIAFTRGSEVVRKQK